MRTPREAGSGGCGCARRRDSRRGLWRVHDIHARLCRPRCAPDAAAPPTGPDASAHTIISLTFDDTFADEQRVGAARRLARDVLRQQRPGRSAELHDARAAARRCRPRATSSPLFTPSIIPICRRSISPKTPPDLHRSRAVRSPMKADVSGVTAYPFARTRQRSRPIGHRRGLRLHDRRAAGRRPALGRIRLQRLPVCRESAAAGSVSQQDEQLGAGRRRTRRRRGLRDRRGRRGRRLGPHRHCTTCATARIRCRVPPDTLATFLDWRRRAPIAARWCRPSTRSWAARSCRASPGRRRTCRSPPMATSWSTRRSRSTRTAMASPIAGSTAAPAQTSRRTR